MKILKINKHSFELSINFLTLKKIRTALSLPAGEPLDLLNIVKLKSDGTIDSSLLETLAGNSFLLIEMLYIMLRDQLDAKKIAEEDFYKMLSADDIERAVDLLMEELLDFFPEAKGRVLRRFWEAVKRIEEEARENLDMMLEDEGLEKKIRGALSSSAQGSSE